MPQHLKESVREKILTSAAAVFAGSGYRAATMAAIAQDAGLSVGNLYRYFPSKDSLLEALLPEATVQAIRSLVLGRLQWLSSRASPDPYLGSDPRALARDRAQELAQRRPLLRILLSDLEGSPHQEFSRQTCTDLVEAFLAWAAHSSRPLGAGWRPRLERLYTSLLRQCAEILSTEGEDLEAELAALLTYHVAGMQALLAHAASGRGPL